MSVYNEKERYHALDSLRAVMMLLGVVLHAALPYATYTLGVISAYHDPANDYFLSGVTFLNHLFRMPAFFVVGGFFAAMLFDSRGGRGMLLNRTKRVLLPLIISWVVLFPLTILGAAFTMLGGPKGVSTVIDQLRTGAVLAKNDLTFYDLLTQLGLIHLWFLYYLMIFYVVVAAGMLLVRRMPDFRKAALLQLFGRLVVHPAGILVFSGLTFLSMTAMPAATPDKAGFQNSNAFLPPLQVLFAYFIFFGFGWLLFWRKTLLDSFRNGIGWKILLGLGLAAWYALSVLQPAFHMPNLLQHAVISPAIWLLVFGVIGLFIRYAARPNPVGRYLADASYWIYLVHLPLTLFLPGLLIGVALPGILKFLIVFIITIFLCLLSYHYLVRATRIGKLLNGRKYLRSLRVTDADKA